MSNFKSFEVNKDRLNGQRFATFFFVALIGFLLYKLFVKISVIIDILRGDTKYFFIIAALMCSIGPLILFHLVFLQFSIAVKIKINDEEISYQTIWGVKDSIKMSEILKIQLNKTLFKYLELITPTKKVVIDNRISQHNECIKLIRNRTASIKSNLNENEDI